MVEHPLDPLGIFGLVKKDINRIAAQAKLPSLPGDSGPRFIGSCRVIEGLCHGHSASKMVRCPESELTDEEWRMVWELTEEAFPHGQGNPWMDGWWPATMSEAEKAVSNYAVAIRGAAQKYAARAREAAASYSLSAERAISGYRTYTLSEYSKGLSKARKGLA